MLIPVDQRTKLGITVRVVSRREEQGREKLRMEREEGESQILCISNEQEQDRLPIPTTREGYLFESS